MHARTKLGSKRRNNMIVWADWETRGDGPMIESKTLELVLNFQISLAAGQKLRALGPLPEMEPVGRRHQHVRPDMGAAALECAPMYHFVALRLAFRARVKSAGNFFLVGWFVGSGIDRDGPNLELDAVLGDIQLHHGSL